MGKILYFSDIQEIWVYRKNICDVGIKKANYVFQAKLMNTIPIKVKETAGPLLWLLSEKV